MEEIKIYLNQNESEIQEITFDKVVAGETTQKSIFIENIIDYPIALDLSLIGDNIQLVKTIDSLQPNTMEEVVFELTPEITTMKPITAKLTIKLRYVIG